MRTQRLALLLLAALPACRGPHPVVKESRVLAPAVAGGPTVVDVELENKSGGTGEAALAVRLRDRRTDQAYFHEVTVELEGYERLRAAVPFFVPPGDYAPEIKVEYPPQ